MKEDSIRYFKLYDYNFYDKQKEKKEGEVIDFTIDNKEFTIQMFGINKFSRTASITVKNFLPYFYIKFSDTNWNEQRKNEFINKFLKKKIGNYFENSISTCELIKKHKLYEFDNKKLHTFLKVSFKSLAAFNRLKKIFYEEKYSNGVYEKNIILGGIEYKDEISTTKLELYEGDIPPILKMFHDYKIHPTGWISVKNNKIREATKKATHCYYEFSVNIDNITPQNDKDDLVKYTTMSFDIEASSSHGDFPLAIKDYKKLAKNILENYHNSSDEFKASYDNDNLHDEIMTAFGYDNLDYIQTVYPKKDIDIVQLKNLISNLSFYKPINNKTKDTYVDIEESESDNSDIEEQEETVVFKKKVKKIKSYTNKDSNIVELIKDPECDFDTKVNELTLAFSKVSFPEIEGDKVTFIGCSFMNYMEKEPYKRVIIVLGGCKIPDKYIQWSIDNKVDVLCRKSEKEVLTTFTKIVKSENPHIITGYNITGFDFDFMFKRSQELDCVKEFLKLSRNKDEVCLSKTYNPQKRSYDEDLETNKIVLASGEYNLRFPKMTGRLIIDMCVIFRKEFNLASNKLDYVSSYFISDNINDIKIDNENNQTTFYSKNLTGINVGTFIKFEELGYSNNMYKNGKKFEIAKINKENSSFIINSIEELPIDKYKYKWGLAKDDVSPKQIFELSNGSDYDRWTVGKYCLGDCDNVLWLLTKVDVITEKVEMSNLCDVPLSFLLLRGQGIKLQSYVSKKCGEKNTLMPVIRKLKDESGYEGAHVFEPKRGIYLEDPVACVDYSSLYPSSMISENISHDSKVWTKEYDLSNNLLIETGEKDEDGNYKYDNLYDLGYKYVDIKYDTYEYKRKTPKAAAKKVVVGYKICRYAQFPEGKAIMPSILEELLAARKATRKKILTEKDEFKKNMYDKRQLSIKVTANSLYGQTGAKTSSFYEKDIAACTTAIGRKLLFYGRSIIEECYNEIIVDTSDGNKVLVKAECVYGDTDSVFFKFNIRHPETGEKIINKQALIYTIELAKKAGELASKFLKKPHDLEYEKTFWPWVLLSKKRYVGTLYEEDPEKGKIKYMGLVLKRRDNADIVKDSYGGVIDIIIKEKSIQKAIKFVHECINNLINGEYKLEKLLITKSLRGYYKNPKQIAHKVLADRIGSREPGNKPASGDRMYYAYIKNPNKKALQGEKIETPEFIRENNLELDYSHYITNQIMKPLLQLFALDLEKMNDFKKKRGETLQSWKSELEKLREKWPEDEKFYKKLDELKCKEVKSLIFDKYLKDLK